MQISIKATEPQAAFLGMHCKFPAFVAGFGTRSKSEVMCNSALLDSLEGGASSMIAMYEPTYDLVRLILAPRMEEAASGASATSTTSPTTSSTPAIGKLGDFVLHPGTTRPASWATSRSGPKWTSWTPSRLNTPPRRGIKSSPVTAKSRPTSRHRQNRSIPCQCSRPPRVSASS